MPNYAKLYLGVQTLKPFLALPKSMNVTCILPQNTTAVTGAHLVMTHAVLAFPPPSMEEQPGAILDPFNLEMPDADSMVRGHLCSRVLINTSPAWITMPNETYHIKNSKLSLGVKGAPDDDFLQEVARRAKERWDKRETEMWCQYCSAPSQDDKPLKKCAKCRIAHYCDKEHQSAAWPYHKHFCIAGR